MACCLETVFRSTVVQDTFSNGSMILSLGIGKKEEQDTVHLVHIYRYGAPEPEPEPGLDQKG
jgi:hypothetical protein